MKAALSAKNNFDFLRLLFAVDVLLIHSYGLSLAPQLKFFTNTFGNDINPVKGLFVLSGFLVVLSYERSRGFWQYLDKRLRRVYPAYFTVIIVCAVIGALFTTVPLQQYFSLDWIKYLFSNLSFANFLHPTLPGLFENNTYHAVNGALWTMKVEMMFYLSVPIFCYFFRRFSKPLVFIIIYLFSYYYSTVLIEMGTLQHQTAYLFLAEELPGQLCYILSGSILFYYLEHFSKHCHRYALLALLACVLGCKIHGLGVLIPLSFSSLVIYIACCVKYLGNFGKFGDLSYGVYIYHYPTLQILVSLGFMAVHPILGVGITLCVVFSMALCSWHLVEKYFLRSNSHYVKAASKEVEAKLVWSEQNNG